MATERCTSRRVERIRAEYERRARLVERMGEDREARAAALAHYRHNPVAFVEDLVVTYDPRNTSPIPKRLPMKLWPRQVELIEALRVAVTRGQNLLVKKARAVGFSWLAGAFAVWLWLFEPDTVVTFGSRKLELVDRLGDPKALFTKVRDVLYGLPAFMLPEGYNRNEHDSFCRIVNPENGSVITGEAGDQMGRGGRSTLYILDEFAFVNRAEMVDAAVNDNARTVVYGSTSNGVGTLFYQKEKSGHVPVFYFSWRDNPNLDDEWAAQKERDIGPVAFASEHSLDDTAAVDNLLVPGAWVESSCAFYERLQGDAEMRTRASEGQRVAGLDVADQGADANVFTVRKGALVEHIEDWTKVLPRLTARRALLGCVARQVDRLTYDRGGPGASVEGEHGTGRYNVDAVGMMMGSRPSHTCYADAPERPAFERFANWGTEAWWAMRLRFMKTHEFMNGIADHPLDELIAIPRHAKLVAELSSRQFEPSSADKVTAESKKKMRARGVASPDFADSLAYCIAPVSVWRSQVTGEGAYGSSAL